MKWKQMGTTKFKFWQRTRKGKVKRGTKSNRKQEKERGTKSNRERENKKVRNEQPNLCKKEQGRNI